MAEDSPSRRSVLKGLATGVGVTVGAGTLAGGSTVTAAASDEGPVAVDWRRRYEGRDREFVLRGEAGHSVVEREGGGYAIATEGRAVSASGASDDRSFALVLTDDSGVEQAICPVDDGVPNAERNCRDAVRAHGEGDGVVLVGEARAADPEETDPFGDRVAAMVVAADADGSVRWKSAYETPQKDPNPDARFADERYESTFHAVERTSDGGYLLGGQDSGWEWLVKIAADGSVQWQYHADHDDGYATFGTVQSVAPTSDGGAVYVTTASIVRVDGDGTERWAKNLTDATDATSVLDVIRTRDGGFAVTGDVNGGQEADDPNDFLLVSLDAAGTVRWERLYDGPHGADVSYRVIQTADDGFLVAGTMEDAYEGDRQLAVVKAAPDGTERWRKLLTNSDETPIDPACLIETTDGGYLLLSGVYEDTNADPEKNGSDLLAVKFGTGTGCDYDGIVAATDANGDCSISTDELSDAIQRWVRGEFDTPDLMAVVSAWAAS